MTLTLVASSKPKPSFRNLIATMQPLDWVLGFLLVAVMCYYGFFNPVVFWGIIAATICFYPFLGIPTQNKKNEGRILKTVVFTLPYTNIKVYLRFWHLFVLTLAAVILINHSHADAFFLNHLKSKMETAVCEAISGAGAGGGVGGANGGTTINSSCSQKAFITNFFLLVQILVGLGVVGTFIAGLIQASQQNDPSNLFRLSGIILIVVVLIEGFSRVIVS